MSTIILTAAPSANDVVKGFDSGIDVVGYVLWKILDKTSPLLALILVGILAFTLCKTGFKIEDMHTQWTDHMFKIIGLIICVALLASFSLWGDKMLGDYSPKDIKLGDTSRATASIEYLDEVNF